jgi:integrase
MLNHNISVLKQKERKVPIIFIRGKTIWISYYVDDKRIRKSTKLKNNPQNIKLVKSEVIPQLILKIQSGEIYKRKPKTFKYYADILISIKEKKLRAFELKVGCYNRVITFFGKKDIDTITRLDIKQYLNNLNMKSMSKNTYKSIIKEVFELAVDDAVITVNPALNISLPPDIKGDIEYFTKAEVNLIR